MQYTVELSKSAEAIGKSIEMFDTGPLRPSTTRAMHSSSAKNNYGANKESIHVNKKLLCGYENVLCLTIDYIAIILL